MSTTLLNDPYFAGANCIDGQTTNRNNFCHTEVGSPGWLVITVKEYWVTKMVVYNRNGYEDRINGAQILYSNDFAGTSIIYQASFDIQSVYTFNIA